MSEDCRSVESWTDPGALPQHTRKEFNSFFCYLIVVTAVSLATFVALLMVFLLETALQEGIPLH